MTKYFFRCQPPAPAKELLAEFWRLKKEAICVFLDAKLAEVERIVAGIESQIATLTAYRNSLIHECVTGQRRITEADVERAQNKRGPT